MFETKDFDHRAFNASGLGTVLSRLKCMRLRSSQ